MEVPPGSTCSSTSEANCGYGPTIFLSVLSCGTDRGVRYARSAMWIPKPDRSLSTWGATGCERIEEHRAGAALELRMQLWTRIEMGGETTDSQVEEIALKVSRDDWLPVLRLLTGERVDLLEIRYDLVYAARYKASVKEIGLAQEAVDRGDFNRAVLQARKAVTLMEESVRATTGEDLRVALTDRIDKRHADLYLGIVTRAKDMGNFAAHRPEAREYTRVEALFAIRLATISLEVVAGLLAL